MARKDEEDIRIKEAHAARLGYSVVEYSLVAGERELAEQFRWIAAQLLTMGEKLPLGADTFDGE